MTAPPALVELPRFLPCPGSVDAGQQLDAWCRGLLHHGQQAAIGKPGSANLQRALAAGEPRFAIPMAIPKATLVGGPLAAAPRSPQHADATVVLNHRRLPIHARLGADNLFLRPILAVKPARDDGIFPVVRPLPFA